MSTNYYIVDIFKEAEYNKLMKEIKLLESKITELKKGMV